MKPVVVCITLLTLFGSSQAQYQKMVRANSLRVAASDVYATVGWSRQLDVRTDFALRGIYFRDDTERFSIDNFGAGLDVSRWLFRFNDVFISGGAGVFIVHTEGESAAATKADDFSGGASFNAELEYYPTWWLVLSVEVRQLVFLGSDFFNSRILPGAGLKLVF